jgi:hypothetical protein
MLDDARRALDAMHEHGLRAILGPSRDEKTYEQTQADTLALVEAFREHEAVLAWLILDEPSQWWEGPSGRVRGQIAALSAAVKRADPRRPAFVVDVAWTPGEGTFGGLAATDLGCLDNYPAGRSQNPVQAIANSVERMRPDCRRARKPLAFWLQLAGGYGPFPREPTYEEARASAYVAIIGGARVLLHWCYKPMSATLWAGFRELTAELRRLERVILDPEARWLATGVAGRSVYYSAWECRSVRILVLCNTAPWDADATLDLQRIFGPGPSTQVKPWFDDAAAIELAAGRCRVRPGPQQRSVLELT